MKIFDPKLTGSIEILNTIQGNVTIAGGLNVEGSLGGSATTASYVEYTDVVNKPTLISGSSQIASDISGSFTSLSSSLASELLKNTTDTLDGDLTVTGKITAQEFHTEFVSASIIYQSGSTQFGNSSDDTHVFTGKVGVGTTTPTPNADTAYNSIQIGESAILSGYNSGASLLAVGENFYWDSGWKYLTSAPASTHQMNTGTHSFRVASSGTAGGSLTWISALDINNSGNVGIGESGPLGKLHIKGSDTGVATPSAQGNLLVLEDAENGLSILSSTAGAGYINFGDSDDNDVGMIIYGHSSNAMSFWTNAGKRMTIDSSGNVGIGTSSPSTKLTLVKATRSNTLGNSSVLQISDASSAGQAVGDRAEINFYTNSDSLPGNLQHATIGIIKTDTTGYEKADLYFGTSTIGGSPVERMRIDSSGNVGIGTSNPAVKLNISHESHGLGLAYVGSTLPSLAGIYTSSSIGQTGYGSLLVKARSDYGGFYSINFFTASSNNVPTERMRITSGGALCVGTTSAGAFSGDGVITFGGGGGIVGKSASVTNGSTLDITVGGGGGYQGFLAVAVTVEANAALRTQRTYSVFARGTDSSIQQIASDNGTTGGASFSVTVPTAGTIRVTNTSGFTCFIAMQYFGGTSY